jgi:hypothetical protein
MELPGWPRQTFTIGGELTKYKRNPRDSAEFIDHTSAARLKSKVGKKFIVQAGLIRDSARSHQGLDRVAGSSAFAAPSKKVPASFVNGSLKY